MQTIHGHKDISVKASVTCCMCARKHSDFSKRDTQQSAPSLPGQVWQGLRKKRVSRPPATRACGRKTTSETSCVVNEFAPGRWVSRMNKTRKLKPQDFLGKPGNSPINYALFNRNASSELGLLQVQIRAKR